MAATSADAYRPVATLGDTYEEPCGPSERCPVETATHEVLWELRQAWAALAGTHPRALDVVDELDAMLDDEDPVCEALKGDFNGDCNKQGFCRKEN